MIQTILPFNNKEEARRWAHAVIAIGALVLVIGYADTENFVEIPGTIDVVPFIIGFIFAIGGLLLLGVAEEYE